MAYRYKTNEPIIVDKQPEEGSVPTLATSNSAENPYEYLFFEDGGGDLWVIGVSIAGELQITPYVPPEDDDGADDDGADDEES